MGKKVASQTNDTSDLRGSYESVLFRFPRRATGVFLEVLPFESGSFIIIISYMPCTDSLPPRTINKFAEPNMKQSFQVRFGSNRCTIESECRRS